MELLFWREIIKMCERALWQEYQHAIAELFRRHPEAIVDEDVQEVGQDSRILRQLDVRILLQLDIELSQGITPNIDVKIIADAKLYNKRLDVNDIGKLAVLKDDVRAHLMVAVTSHGASQAGIQLGQNRGVYVLTATPDLLALLQDMGIPDISPCTVCGLGTITWNQPNELVLKLTGGHTLYLEGTCNDCSTIHFRCGDCGVIQGIPDGKILKCPGCGLIAWIGIDPQTGSPRLDTKDSLDIALLSTAYSRKTGRVSQGEVDRLIARTKWHHWPVMRPTISLEEGGLMEWKDDDYLYITGDGRGICRLLERAEESPHYHMDAQSQITKIRSKFDQFGVRPLKTSIRRL